MADEMNDGGPAFPGMSPMRSMDPVTGKIEAVRTDYDGMSLRDYFAAAAITSAAQIVGDDDWNAIAAHCYAAADAMISASKKGGV